MEKLPICYVINMIENTIAYFILFDTKSSNIIETSKKMFEIIPYEPEEIYLTTSCCKNKMQNTQ